MIVGESRLLTGVCPMQGWPLWEDSGPAQRPIDDLQAMLKLVETVAFVQAWPL